MDKGILKKRTKSNQLVRYSGFAGANYHAVCRAKLKADFINKLKIVEKEFDKSMFFIELVIELDSYKKGMITGLWREATELLSIIVASLTTLRKSLVQS